MCTHKLTKVIPFTKEVKDCWTKPQVLRSKSMCSIYPPGVECVCVDDNMRLFVS